MFLKVGDNILFNKKEELGKNIEMFYGVRNVNGADILTSSGVINIYKVNPSLVLDTNEELENTFYHSYIWSIKMMKGDYQIIINTSKLKLDKAFENLSKIEYKTQNVEQKKLISNYQMYLKELSDNVEIYERNILLVVKKLSVTEEKQFIEGLRNLDSLGVNVEKITKREDILKILYESFNKRWEG